MEKFMNVTSFIIRCRKTLSIICLLLPVLCSCSQSNTEPETPACLAVYGGEQEGNDFQLWVWLYEDNTAKVVSGTPQWNEEAKSWVNCDLESLTYVLTETGLNLIESNRTLYQGICLDEEWDKRTLPINLQLTWEHSPGIVWDTNAGAGKWLSSMCVTMSVTDHEE